MGGHVRSGASAGPRKSRRDGTAGDVNHNIPLRTKFIVIAVTMAGL